MARNHKPTHESPAATQTAQAEIAKKQKALEAVKKWIRDNINKHQWMKIELVNGWSVDVEEYDSLGVEIFDAKQRRRELREELLACRRKWQRGGRAELDVVRKSMTDPEDVVERELSRIMEGLTTRDCEGLDTDMPAV